VYIFAGFADYPIAMLRGPAVIGLATGLLRDRQAAVSRLILKAYEARPASGPKRGVFVAPLYATRMGFGFDNTSQEHEEGSATAVLKGGQVLQPGHDYPKVEVL